jgi:hypothetical protein
VREVLKRALSLPDYSKVEDVDLMAFRILEIEDGEGKIRIPHMVHSFQEREVSVFVLDEAKHQSLSKSLDNEGEGGCSSCGVVIRRRGPNILVFISVMEMAKLGDFARQL